MRGAAGILLLLCLAATPATTMSTSPATRPLGPDVVLMRELVDEYEPVPFDHRTHATMAQMWDGCTTCHHRTPAGAPATRPVAVSRERRSRTQDRAADVPACKSCHLAGAPGEVEAVDIRMPTLKGAYHRQCLNCHREWAHANDCDVCHRPRNVTASARATSRPAPTPDDIVGRMHPPIAAPEVKVYQARFLPAVGGNAIFRHKEHVEQFGLKCVSCHRRDTCSDCHDARAKTLPQASRPVRPGRTWVDSHGACVACHQQDRCRHCHYADGQSPPPPFEHRMTGQAMDKEHAGLKCVQCHDGRLKLNRTTTCGGAECHKGDRLLAYPVDKPGPVVSSVAATSPTTRLTTVSPLTQPTTRASIQRIRVRYPGDDEPVETPDREAVRP
jgi:hypothetical protein